MKSIFTSLSPNLSFQDVRLALKLLFTPQKWNEGAAIAKLEDALEEYLGLSNVVLFENGRSAFLAILKSLEIGKGDEVLLQAFTCVAAVNPIIWVGAKPVFVDIEKETLNMSVTDLKSKVTSQTKAIVIQHTFGLPGPIVEILEIAKDNDLFVIEDCAHSLGGEFEGQKLGTFGDAAFFSFSRDKVIGTAAGGSAIFNFHPPAGGSIFNKKLRQLYNSLLYPSKVWLVRQLLYSITSRLIVKTYNWFSLGKLLHWLLLTFGFRTKATTVGEKRRAEKPSWVPSKMPNVLAELALNQFQRLDQFNKHRGELARFYVEQLTGLAEGGQIEIPASYYHNIYYDSGGGYLRFPILVDDALRLMEFAKEHGIVLGDWYNRVIAPKEVNLEVAGYLKHSCPIAEEIVQRIVNLPTGPNISLEDAKRVVGIVRGFFER